jgi:hypothetical protein
MDVKIAALPTFADLRDHVRLVLCLRDRVDPDQTVLQQALIVRSGKPCGLLFQVRGPRLLKTHAVWAGHEDRILFYDSRGLRFAETHLCEGPDMCEIATEPLADSRPGSH